MESKMEASAEIKIKRMEGWREEISRLRQKCLRQVVAILAGMAVVAAYMAVEHCQGEVVFFLMALAFLVLAHMQSQIRVMRFVEKDILSHVLLPRNGGLTE